MKLHVGIMLIATMMSAHSNAQQGNSEFPILSFRCMFLNVCRFQIRPNSGII